MKWRGIGGGRGRSVEFRWTFDWKGSWVEAGSGGLGSKLWGNGSIHTCHYGGAPWSMEGIQLLVARIIKAVRHRSWQEEPACFRWNAAW